MANSTDTIDTPDALKAVQRGVDSAGTALHNTIEKIAEPTRSGVDRAATVAHETVDKLAINASSAAEKISEKTRRLTDAPNRALESSKDWVKDEPVKAIGAALAIGFILGRLLR